MSQDANPLHFFPSPIEEGQVIEPFWWLAKVSPPQPFHALANLLQLYLFQREIKTKTQFKVRQSITAYEKMQDEEFLVQNNSTKLYLKALCFKHSCNLITSFSYT